MDVVGLDGFGEILTEPTTGDKRLRDVVRRGIDRMTRRAAEHKKLQE